MTQNLATQKMLEELKNQIFDEEHPVNSHAPQFEGEQEPAARKGWRGTWAIDTDYTGRVLVGSGTDFTLGATGGNAEHQHTYSVAYFEFYGTLSGTDSAIQVNEQWATNFLPSEVIPRNKAFQTDMESQEISHRVVWGNTGKSVNLPPYKVVAVWKRIA